MKVSDCKHMPQEFAKTQAQECQEGDIEMHDNGLRVCLTCGHVGCCDEDGAHARKHAEKMGHQVMASYPANEDSFIWCYEDNDYIEKES
jgi:uncharacterized UBP type Zn finger protein